jgi:hypothetical protein
MISLGRVDLQRGADLVPLLGEYLNLRTAVKETIKRTQTTPR